MSAEATRKLAVQQVLARLEEMVRQGQLLPGGRLPPERELARRLSTSRATLREALRVFRELGVIDSAPRRGTRVVGAPPVPVSMVFPNLVRFANPEDVMQARIVLEPGVAAVAAVRSSPGDWQLLRECVREGLASGSAEQFEHWDREFHVRLAKSTRNEALAHLSVLLQGIRDEVVWGNLKRRDLSHEGRPREYAADHERIVEAVEARDAAEAYRRMREHLMRVRANLLGGADALGSVPPFHVAAGAQGAAEALSEARR